MPRLRYHERVSRLSSLDPSSRSPSTLVLSLALAMSGCGGRVDTVNVAPIARPAPTLTKPPVRSRDDEGAAFDAPGSRGARGVDLDGDGPPKRTAPIVCPPDAKWSGSACVVSEVECPAHAKLVGTRCIGEVRCPDDSAWDGSGCRPFAKLPPPPPGTAPNDKCAANLASIPTSDVFLDGAALGPTPRVRVPIAPGVHQVLFVSADGTKRTITFECRSGETKTVAVKMSR